MSDKRTLILNSRINVITWDEAIRQIVNWGAAHESRYVCVCNVHSVVNAWLDSRYKAIVNGGDMATPDGAPIAWALRRMGFTSQERISGPDLMWKYLAEAERLGQVVFFYGSTEATLAKLRHAVLAQFPGLRIGGTYSPPFGNLTSQEDEMEVDIINAAQPHVVLVGLGCPKQEKWMAAHWSRVNAVMIGVGAAFDYHAGTLKRAPLWWQNHGLEWLYRLTSEPRRLFMRYLITNSLFIIGISKQLLSDKVAKLIRPSTVEQSNR